MKLKLRLPQSILGHTLLLMVGMVASLTLLNLAIILLRPPPHDVPISAYEVARLLRGEPIAKDAGDTRARIAPQPPKLEGHTKEDRLIEIAVAHRLGVPLQDVRLHGFGAHPEHEAERTMNEQRELAAYGIDRFDPAVLGSFTAAARLPDGRWRVVSREGRQSTATWQIGTALRIGILLLFALPIAWLFSRRLARPIRAFAAAADRIGAQRQAEPVEVTGPSEIRLAAAAINEMQTRIARYVTERTSVVGALAHDLRTPLSRLNFHLAAAPEAVRQKAEVEIAEMEQMIASTLAFVETETRARPAEPVDLALLVEGVVDDLADLGRDVTLAGVVPAIVLGDTVLLKRLFANLINNAVTYGRRATVTLSRSETGAIVEVSDQGPGLAGADLERAFEPFYRAESSRNRATGGTGLGLAIVKAAAERHGGSVVLLNRPSGGLTARVSLPAI